MIACSVPVVQEAQQMPIYWVRGVLVVCKQCIGYKDCFICYSGDTALG